MVAKIKEQYKGVIIKDNRIGRALEVNEKNLPTLLMFGHEYLLEYEELKKDLDNEHKTIKKRSKRNNRNPQGEADA